MRGAQQVRGVELLVLVVEDRGLDRPLQELVGMAAEELVERVVARDVDREPAAAPPGPAPHLAQRRDGPRERHTDRGIQRPDVDPQLQGIGRHDAEQLAVHQPPLELAPLRRRVARPVRRDPLGQRRVAAPRQLQRREARHQLDRLARLHEHDRARALDHQLREQVGGLGQGRAPRGRLVIGDRRVPHRHRALGAGRAVAVDHRDVVEPGQARGQLARVRDRGRREQEPRRGAVHLADPAQPPQDVGHVRAEHAAVHVRLVDDDHGEVGEEVSPGRVVREDPEVQHVGVGEDQVGPPPQRRALLARCVAVVDRRSRAFDGERVK